jgi:hypothetical protein
MTGWSDGGRRRRGGHGNRRWCRELAAVDETRRGARDEIHKAKGDPDTWTSQPGRRRSIAGVIDLREEDNRDGENFKMPWKDCTEQQLLAVEGRGGGGSPISLFVRGQGEAVSADTGSSDGAAMADRKMVLRCTR